MRATSFFRSPATISPPGRAPFARSAALPPAATRHRRSGERRGGDRWPAARGKLCRHQRRPHLHLHPLQAEIVEPVRPALLMIAGLVVVVLLIAGVNLTNLLLARAVSRAREMAVRGALGASRWRLARASIVEASLLAAVGAVPPSWSRRRSFVASRTFRRRASTARRAGDRLARADDTRTRCRGCDHQRRFDPVLLW